MDHRTNHAVQLVHSDLLSIRYAHFIEGWTPSSSADGQDGRARSTMRPARRMAELDRTRDQLGHPPS
ncbi:hypothetical protein DY000_02039789 [Brassica cretica]|uniref:Uncharacterized protein n=1 Tax=Brassica cretica TaxID=69181 RepID=A0ABQ7BK79_BRACR|nr:hypothetical protein DY000_02039789 [Brassica cretica]